MCRGWGWPVSSLTRARAAIQAWCLSGVLQLPSAVVEGLALSSDVASGAGTNSTEEVAGSSVLAAAK